MSKLTDEQLAELLRLEAEATPGPWRAGKWTGKPVAESQVFCDHLEVTPCPGVTLTEDAALIAAARNALRPLVEELLELREADRALGNLMAVIDGDGGHAQDGHGHEENGKRGERIVCQLRADLDNQKWITEMVQSNNMAAENERLRGLLMRARVDVRHVTRCDKSTDFEITGASRGLAEIDAALGKSR